MKILLTAALVSLGFIVQILVMMHGWGLPPVSWLWIIAGGLASFLLSAVGLTTTNIE